MNNAVFVSLTGCFLWGFFLNAVFSIVHVCFDFWGSSLNKVFGLPHKLVLYLHSTCIILVFSTWSFYSILLCPYLVPFTTCLYKFLDFSNLTWSFLYKSLLIQPRNTWDLPRSVLPLNWKEVRDRSA